MLINILMFPQLFRSTFLWNVKINNSTFCFHRNSTQLKSLWKVDAFLKKSDSPCQFLRLSIMKPRKGWVVSCLAFNWKTLKSGPMQESVEKPSDFTCKHIGGEQTFEGLQLQGLKFKSSPGSWKSKVLPLDLVTKMYQASSGVRYCLRGLKSKDMKTSLWGFLATALKTLGKQSVKSEA